jgi:hypothetical protein
VPVGQFLGPVEIRQMAKNGEMDENVDRKYQGWAEVVLLRGSPDGSVSVIPRKRNSAPSENVT